MEHNAAIKIIINNYDKLLRKKLAENYIYFSTYFYIKKHIYVKNVVRVVG